MGPFPHSAPQAVISAANPAGTDGFESVEFAHPDPAALREVFGRMGYGLTARHKSKDIELWQQSDITYVLNNEPGSHARRFVDAHGPCAPSMCWRVVNAIFARCSSLSNRIRLIVGFWWRTKARVRFLVASGKPSGLISGSALRQS